MHVNRNGMHFNLIWENCMRVHWSRCLTSKCFKVKRNWMEWIECRMYDTLCSIFVVHDRNNLNPWNGRAVISLPIVFFDIWNQIKQPPVAIRVDIHRNLSFNKCKIIKLPEMANIQFDLVNRITFDVKVIQYGFAQHNGSCQIERALVNCTNAEEWHKSTSV